MEVFGGLSLKALREGATGFYSGEALRHYVIDALDELLLDVLVSEPLFEAGRGLVLSHVFWTVSVDSDNGSVELIRTDGEVPTEWTATAALRARTLLAHDGAPPDDDKLVALAERGVTTIACLLFVLSGDGSVSVLYARHPDIEPNQAAALMLNAIERALEKRHVVN